MPMREVVSSHVQQERGGRAHWIIMSGLCDRTRGGLLFWPLQFRLSPTFEQWHAATRETKLFCSMPNRQVFFSSKRQKELVKKRCRVITAEMEKKFPSGKPMIA